MRFILLLEAILALAFLSVVQVLYFGVCLVKALLLVAANVTLKFQGELAWAQDVLYDVAFPPVVPVNPPMSETGVEDKK